ncbi:MAG: hypothetical protein II919_06330 [Lachnospiraceae bacterium]|nr:hypothetical protein [Lachnospiraceae bacterium]
MYINNAKKVKCGIVGGAQMVFGMMSGIMAFVGILEVIGNDPLARDIWGFFVFLTVMTPILFYLGVNNLIVAYYSTRLNEIFLLHSDRIIPVAEITRKMSTDKMLKYLQLMLRKKCFVNVSLNYAGTQPVIVLEDRAVGENARRNHMTEYIVVVCPNCGNSNSVKKGSIANCRSCGQFIKGGGFIERT